jgi:hypothetical protein
VICTKPSGRNFDVLLTETFHGHRHEAVMGVFHIDGVKSLAVWAFGIESRQEQRFERTPKT